MVEEEEAELCHESDDEGAPLVLVPTIGSPLTPECLLFLINFESFDKAYFFPAKTRICEIKEWDGKVLTTTVRSEKITWKNIKNLY